jgi:hypothetical protein
MAQVTSENSTPMAAVPTRRRFLSTASAAGGAVLTLAAIQPAWAAVGSPDPIFVMIETHKKLMAEWQALYDQLDEAQFGDGGKAQERGRRPTQLIRWRGYMIGSGEIDIRRQTLLEAGIDPETVEEEYLGAKARYQRQVEAGAAWDERAGLTALHNDVARGVAADRQYAAQLAQTKPTTLAGAAALIQYVLDDDLVADEDHWHITALRSAVAALNSVGVAVQS